MASAFENMHGSPANVKTIGKKITITIWYQGAFVPPRTLWSVDLAENGKSTVATFYSLYDGPWPQRIVEHCNKKFASTAK